MLMTPTFDVLSEASFHTEEYGEGTDKLRDPHSKQTLTHSPQRHQSMSAGALNKPSSTVRSGRPQLKPQLTSITLAQVLMTTKSPGSAGAETGRTSWSPPYPPEILRVG